MAVGVGCIFRASQTAITARASMEGSEEMGRSSDVMRECMKAYCEMVMKAENGDVAARSYLIDGVRGDSTKGNPITWGSYEEWRSWNQSKGSAIRHMVHSAKGSGRLP